MGSLKDMVSFLIIILIASNHFAAAWPTQILQTNLLNKFSNLINFNLNNLKKSNSNTNSKTSSQMNENDDLIEMDLFPLLPNLNLVNSEINLSNHRDRNFQALQTQRRGRKRIKDSISDNFNLKNIVHKVIFNHAIRSKLLDNQYKLKVLVFLDLRVTRKRRKKVAKKGRQK